jgi:hypothetical protein
MLPDLRPEVIEILPGVIVLAVALVGFYFGARWLATRMVRARAQARAAAPARSPETGTRLAVGVGLVLVLLYGASWVYEHRTGRYQVASTPAGFVVLNTSTGEHWTYERGHELGGMQHRIVYRLVDAAQRPE